MIDGIGTKMKSLNRSREAREVLRRRRRSIEIGHPKIPMRGIFAAHAFAAFATSVQILFHLESLPHFDEFNS
jgi:hypothetical protein